MEKMGRGSVLIQKACADHGLPQPKWSENERGVVLTFFAPGVIYEVPPRILGIPREVPGKLGDYF